MTTDREQTIAAARRWLDGYLRAWRSNDGDDIRAIFTEDAEYLTEPWLTGVRGHDGIVEDWLKRRDEPDAFTFHADVVGVDGSRVFLQGETRYAPGPTYSNLWVVELADDGRATSFTEWWMDQAHKS